MNAQQPVSPELERMLKRLYALLERADYVAALGCLDQIIGCCEPQAYLLELRAELHRQMQNWRPAVADARRAVALNPDNAANYAALGVFMTMDLFDSMPQSLLAHQATLETIITCYHACLTHDPSHTTAWINITETYLFLRRWDDAISHYAQCQPYVNDRAHQITRAWQGCLALSLAGDTIEHDDSALLYDQSIRLPAGFHDVTQVDWLLAELQREQFVATRLERAKAVHRAFLSHFDTRSS